MVALFNMVFQEKTYKGGRKKNRCPLKALAWTNCSVNEQVYFFSFREGVKKHYSDIIGAMLLGHVP